MAIKNTILGGVDWRMGQALLAVDINDTFNKLVNIMER